jgi:hypothetical protein
LLALAASSSSLPNGFAFDDLAIIVSDRRIHRLRLLGHVFLQPYWGPPAPPGLYRPLTSLLFGLQWSVGHESPWPFHVLNVILYVLVCLLVYRLAARLLGATAGWWAGALFAVHPVHVEAVGNSVGQAELWAALWVLLSVIYYLRVRADRDVQARDVLVICALYATACLFKEHAVMLPLLLLSAELSVFRRTLGDALRSRPLRMLALGLAITAIAFWTAHTLVVGGLAGDKPALALRDLGFGGRVLTMLGVVPEWARLLFFPARLKLEYQPQEITVGSSFGWLQTLGCVLLLLALWVAVRWRERLPAGTFALAWCAVTLLPVSNLVVPGGVLLAERTLFLPSVGAALLLGVAVSWLERRVVGRPLLHRLAAALGLVVLASGAIRSAARQTVWKSEASFLAQLPIDTPRSYRTVWMAARLRLNAGDQAAGDRGLERAVAMFRGDPVLLAEMAERYRDTGRCGEAAELYRESLRIDPSRKHLRRRLVSCLTRLGRFDEARREALVTLAQGVEGASWDLARLDSLELVGRQRR